MWRGGRWFGRGECYFVEEIVDSILRADRFFFFFFVAIVYRAGG